MLWSILMILMLWSIFMILMLWGILMMIVFLMLSGNFRLRL